MSPARPHGERLLLQSQYAGKTPRRAVKRLAVHVRGLNGHRKALDVPAPRYARSAASSLYK